MENSELIKTIVECNTSTDPEWEQFIVPREMLEKLPTFLLEAIYNKWNELGLSIDDVYSYSQSAEEESIIDNIISSVLTIDSEAWTIIIVKENNSEAIVEDINQRLVHALPDIILSNDLVQIASNRGHTEFIEIESIDDVNYIATSILEALDARELEGYYD